MNLLQVFNASKSFGSKVLFDAVGFTVNDGEHIGVIGPNGAGKSTLFKILVGQSSFDSGQITKLSNLRIGYLEQEADWDTDLKVEDYLSTNTITPLWELKKLGLSLGLQDSDFAKDLQSLSGGYRMRVKLLYLIGLEPDLLLLDEPTNFLDLESILALEDFLRHYKKAFLLISHDRDFLRRTTEYTLEVEDQNIVKYPGNIDDYFEQKEELKQIQISEAANQEAKRKHLQEFVDRFKAKATKARQAQSRMKQLEKMDIIEIKKTPAKATIQLPQPHATGKEIIHIHEADLGYNDTIILKKVSLRIDKFQKLGIVGVNGAGKSTLLKSLAEKIPLLCGHIKYGHNVSLSYFAQHLADELHPEDTVLDALEKKAHTSCTRQDILNIAGSLLFSGDSIHKKIHVLSGGEKTRVALGQILLQRHPVLLMDEPTNHLDFDTVNALAQAIEDFEGTVVVISHDRNFIRRISKHILEIRNGQVEIFPGSYDDYLWSIENGSMKERYLVADEKNQSTVTTKTDLPKKFNYKEEQKRLNAEIKDIERKMSKTEDMISTLNKDVFDLNNQLLQTQGLKAQDIAKQSAEISKKITELEDHLLLDMEKVESLKNDLKTLTE